MKLPFSDSSNKCSYAQVVKDSVSCNNRVTSQRDWIKSRKGRKFCFRCGDFSHVAKDCRDPIRCFRCGSFGHKRFDCWKSENKSKKNSNIDHGFLFVLKCMKLKRVLLDHLWTQRNEGIDLLEDLFKHFEAINSVNIGRNSHKNTYFSCILDGRISNTKIRKSNRDRSEKLDVVSDVVGSKVVVGIKKLAVDDASIIHVDLEVHKMVHLDTFLLDPVILQYNSSLQSILSNNQLQNPDTNFGIGQYRESNRYNYSTNGFEIKISNRFDCLKDIDDSVTYSTDSRMSSINVRALDGCKRVMEIDCEVVDNIVDDAVMDSVEEMANGDVINVDIFYGDVLKKVYQGDDVYSVEAKSYSVNGNTRDLVYIDYTNGRTLDEIEFNCLDEVLSVEVDRDNRNLEGVISNQIILFNDLKTWLDDIISGAGVYLSSGSSNKDSTIILKPVEDAVVLNPGCSRIRHKKKRSCSKNSLDTKSIRRNARLGRVNPGASDCSSSGRRVLWAECLDSRTLAPGPWIIGGEFNVTRFLGKRSPREGDLEAMEEFDSFIINCNLNEIKLNNWSFIWSNNREIPSMALLDRFIISDEIEDKFPSCKVVGLPCIFRITVQLFYTVLMQILVIKILDLKRCGYGRIILMTWWPKMVFYD